MNGMKFNAALIFAIVLQAVALVWYVSKIDSRVNILYEKYDSIINYLDDFVFFFRENSNIDFEKEYLDFYEKFLPNEN